MTRFHGLVYVIALAIVLALPDSSLSQGLSSGMLTENAPVFLYPDATRTPLATLDKGTTVRVLERQGDWYRIEFRDARFGDRTGYIRADRVAVQPSAKPQVPPQGPASRPRVPLSTARRPGQRPVTPIVREPLTISLNGGLQTTSRNFEAASTFDAFLETGTLNSAYTSDPPFVIDAGVQVGVWRALTVGVAATRASKPLGGDLTAEIPHPFFFDRRRSVSGTSPGLRREEVSAHLNAGWTAAAGASTRVTIFAGPSYFQVTQGLITDLTVTEEYPYDSASFVSAATSETTQTKWGYNVGFDVTQRVWKSLGLGVIGRYSRASFTFPIVADHNATIDAGGFQAGGGVRLQF